MLTIKDYLKYEQPTKYIVEHDNYDSRFNTPVLTAGQTFILGYTNEKDNIFDASKENVIIFDDFTTSIQFVNFPFKVKSSAMKILHANNGTNIKFCYYLLKSIKINNDTHKRYWISEYENMPVKEYSNQDQEEIVNNLDKITLMIENRKKQLKEHENFIKSYFYNLFGDIKKNDNKFSIKELEQISKISSSKRIYAKEYVSSGIPFYRGTEIVELSNGNSPKNILYISEDRYNEIKEKYDIPKKGDILITAVGTVGKTWVVDTETPFYYKDGNVISIRLNDEISDVYFKYALDNLIEEFKYKNVNGSSYSALTIDKFKTMKIIVPPYDLQKKFSEVINIINKENLLIKKEINDLEKLFDIKLKEYFNN